jgi:hypothetical protein
MRLPNNLLGSQSPDFLNEHRLNLIGLFDIIFPLAHTHRQDCFKSLAHLWTLAHRLNEFRLRLAQLYFFLFHPQFKAPSLSNVH